MKGKDLVGGGNSWIYMWFNQFDDGPQVCDGFEIEGGTFGWTKGSGDCVAEEAFTSMTISVYTAEDSGKVWFDKVNIKAVAP